MTIPKRTRRAAAGTAALAAGVAALAWLSAGQILATDGGPPPPAVRGGALAGRESVGLTAADIQQATAIAMKEPLATLLGGSPGLRLSDPKPWQSKDGRLLGVTFVLETEEPVSGTFPFIVSRYDEGAGRGSLRRFKVPLEVTGMERLDVTVELESARVVEMAPADGTEISEPSEESDSAAEGNAEEHEGADDESDDGVRRSGRRNNEGNKHDGEEQDNHEKD